MNRDDRTNHPPSDLGPLFEAAKVVDPIAAPARARALARARVTAARSPALIAWDAKHARTPRLRFALAAAVALIFGATGAVAAFLQHRSAGFDRPGAPAPQAAPEPAPEDRPMVRAPAPPTVPVGLSPARHGHATRVRGSSTIELALIQRAQEAYADGDLRAALDLLASHGRRFPNGRFAEEREALRVRSLARCGRRTEAGRALQAFADRFPNSVLLPHLREALADARARP